MPASAPEVYRLFLLQPTVVLSAQVNASLFVYPISQVTYDNATGDFNDVEVGMDIWFGSTAGAYDLGISRIRQAATADTLYFGRSSRGVRLGEVNLTDNVYITVKSLYRVWARPPFISSTGEILKDPGLDVEWRTTTPPPVCNIGAGFAATIDSGTSVITASFDATGSYATADGASISTYLWDVDDGTITVGSTTTSTITATFPAGFRWVSCTVTDSEGHTATMRVPVFARDPADDDTIPFQFTNHRIGTDGQRIAARVLADIDADNYPPGTLAMLWKGEPSSASDRSHMTLPCGWVDDEPAQIEAQRTGTLRDVTLHLVDVAGRLDSIAAYTQRVEDDSIREAVNTAEGKSLPISWFYFVDLNLDLYVHYLLAWHSSALALADFYWSETGSDYAVTGLHSDGQSLWDQIAGKCRALRPDYHFTCDRLGALRMVVDPMLQNAADRTATIQATLDASDWSDLRYTAQARPRLHWLRSGAVRTSAAIVASAAASIAAGEKPVLPTAFSVAPGDAPGQGELEQTANEGLTVSQTTLNETEGHRYARLNAPQSEFRITLADGDDRGIEPADLTWVRLTIPAAVAAQRGLTFTEARGLPKELNIRYSHAREGLTKTIELVWERETSGTPAVTEVKPQGDVPGDDTTWPGDYFGSPPGDVVTPPDVPPLPLYEGQNIVAILDVYGQIFRTSDFQNASPTWDRKQLPSISGSEKVHSFVVDPFSPLYRGTGSTVNGFVATENFIFKVTDIFGASPGATQVFEFDEIANPDLDRFRSIQASFGRFFAEETDNPWLMVVSHYGNRPNHEGTWVNYSTDGGQTWSGESRITEYYDPETGEFREPPIGVYLSPKTPGLAYTSAYLATAPEARAYISEDWGATWTVISSPAIDPEDGLGGDYHVPWPDNDDETVVYHGRWTKGDPLVYYAFRVEENGSTVADISPSHDSRTFGVNRFSFAVRTFDNDRRYVLLCGIANSVSDSEADDVFAAFVSNNYGDTWTNIVDTIAKTDPHPEHGAFAADTEQILYLWGTERYIAYSDDFGATIQDKSGNLPASFPTDVRDLIGLCGGEAPE